MNDKPVIIVGLAIALIILTFPFWYSVTAGAPGTPPDLTVPDGKCVMDTEYMRAHHMDLLDEWRDAVVRKGEKTYHSETLGKDVEMSLTKTCLLECHATNDVGEKASVQLDLSPSNRDMFCHQCHDYAGVQPSCWDCHLEPKGK